MVRRIAAAAVWRASACACASVHVVAGATGVAAFHSAAADASVAAAASISAGTAGLSSAGWLLWSARWLLCASSTTGAAGASSPTYLASASFAATWHGVWARRAGALIFRSFELTGNDGGTGFFEILSNWIFRVLVNGNFNRHPRETSNGF